MISAHVPSQRLKCERDLLQDYVDTCQGHIVGFSDYTLYMSKLGMTVIPELSEARPSEWLLPNHLNRSRFRQFHDGSNLEHDLETIDGLSDHAREK